MKANEAPKKIYVSINNIDGPGFLEDYWYESLISGQEVEYIRADAFELTTEDIKIILDAENNILHECNDNNQLVIETYPKREDYYGEILKRFKEWKETKD